MVSLSRKVDHGDNVISAKVSASPDVSSPVQVTAVSEMGNYTLLVTTDGVGLYDNVSNYYVWRYTA